MAMSREEIDALLIQAKTESAIFIAPKIDEADALLGEAMSAEWLQRFAEFTTSLPEGDLKTHLSNVLSVIVQLPGFLANQRTIIAKYLPAQN